MIKVTAMEKKLINSYFLVYKLYIYFLGLFYGSFFKSGIKFEKYKIRRFV